MASFHYRVGRIVLAIVWAVSLAGSFVECASAVQLNTGDIVISDFLGGVYGLMRIDPVTGDRTIISDATHGSGPTFNFNGADSGGPPSGVSRIAGGDLLVSATNGLFSVDPVTGDRTLINTRPTADAIQVGNQIYAVDGSELYRVDPTTGDTTNLAALGSLADAVVYANGKLFTASAGSITSYSLAGVSLANYIPVAQLVSLAAAPGGILLVGAYDDPISPPLLSSFNPNIPDPFDFQTILPGESPEVGITGIAVAPSGTVWAAIYFVPGGGGPGKVLGIDPTTGNVTVLSDDKHGAGPIFVNPYGLTVVSEPGSFLLAAVAGLALLTLRRRGEGFHRRARSILLAITLAVSLAGSFVECASAVQLNTGDIVISADIGPIAGGEDYGLMRVDPKTGDRTIISDATHGSGPQLNLSHTSTAGVSRLPDGDLLVSATNGLFTVDPATGDRTQINARSTSDAIQVGNQIYAVDGSELFRVDPTTGNTTNLATNFNTAYALDYADGNLFVGLESYSLLGDFIANYAPAYAGNIPVISMASTPDGNVLFGSFAGNAIGVTVGSVNPNVPAPFDYHSLLSGRETPLFIVAGLGVASNGTIWATNYEGSQGFQFNFVMGIDPTTGSRSILSDATHGAGPTFVSAFGLTVVPEPGTFVLAAVGGLALLALRRCTNGFHHHAGRIFLAITLAVSLAGSLVECACAVQLNTGDIVISADIGPIAGGEDYGLMRVDPVTGDRTIISDATHGSGPAFDFSQAPSGGPPSGVSRMAGGDLLVAATNGLFSVDPTTGDRTQITSRPAADAIQVGKQIYAVDGSELFRVDPTTGNTTNLAGLGGNAGALLYNNGLLFTAGPGSINGYSLSGTLVANYLPTSVIYSLAATSDGHILFGTPSATLGSTAIGSFNPNVPDPFDYHSISSGSGAAIGAVPGLGVASNGIVWAANFIDTTRASGNVLGIDPTTGNRSILSDATHGAGPTFVAPYGLTVVPEPGTFVLTVVGGVAILLLRRKK